MDVHLWCSLFLCFHSYAIEISSVLLRTKSGRHRLIGRIQGQGYYNLK